MTAMTLKSRARHLSSLVHKEINLEKNVNFNTKGIKIADPINKPSDKSRRPS